MKEKDCEELEISDEDIKEAFKELKTYLDISLDDFREIYIHALKHAKKRLLSVSADGSTGK
jgi:CBS-domain-containing membrane protein